MASAAVVSSSVTGDDAILAVVEETDGVSGLSIGVVFEVGGGIVVTGYLEGNPPPEAKVVAPDPSWSSSPY